MLWGIGNFHILQAQDHGRCTAVSFHHPFQNQWLETYLGAEHIRMSWNYLAYCIDILYFYIANKHSSKNKAERGDSMIMLRLLCNLSLCLSVCLYPRFTEKCSGQGHAFSCRGSNLDDNSDIIGGFLMMLQLHCQLPVSWLRVERLCSCRLTFQSIQRRNQHNCTRHKHCPQDTY